MKLIVCISEEKGLLFNGRRQSQDAVLRQKVLALSGGSLFLNEYSARQFASQEGLTVREDFCAAAGQDDFCFFEGETVPLAQADELYLFCWNRRYPADSFLDWQTVENDFEPVHTENFAGSSHDKITLTVYRRKGGSAR